MATRRKKIAGNPSTAARIKIADVAIKAENARAVRADVRRRKGELVSLAKVKELVGRIGERVRHDLDSLPVTTAADIAATSDPAAIKARLATGVADCMRHFSSLELSQETVGAKRAYDKS